MEFARLAQIAQLRSEPAGYRARARAGWVLFGQEEFDRIPPVEVVAGVSYPQWFEFEIERDPGNEDDPDLHCYLAFMFDDRELLHVGTLSLVGEQGATLEQLFALRPLAFWKRKALLTLAYFDMTGPRPDDGHWETWSDSDKLMATARAERSLEVPISRRKDRVTTAVLEEVASVYREAWQAGQNPTQSVADHFHKSHSTAARWVGQARKLGILGPADGSRGGEVLPPPPTVDPTFDDQPAAARD